MTRILIASTLTTLLAAGSVAAYQTPPATQGKPPAQQTQTPPATPPPLLPTPQTAAPKPPAVPFPADAKIGFVNLQSVVADSKLGRQGTAAMQDYTTRQNADLTALQKAVSDLQKEIQQGMGVLSQANLQAKNSQLEQKNRDLQHASEDVQAKLQAYNKDLLDAFSDKVIPIVEEIRAEKGLWVIFAVQDDSGGLAVLAANPGLDLSGEVVKRLDTKYPGK